MPRVLVVDDERHVAALLEDALTTWGLDVTTTATGQAAVAAVAEAPPDVVVLDLGLPDMPGSEVLEHLRAGHPALPVLILTGRESFALSAMLRERGAFAVLGKPMDLRKLERAVREAITGRSAS